MTYISSNLTFESDKITYVNSSNQTLEVMMDWEDTIMSASSAYVCENGGDILEIGFGMGISATYIQSHTINSHTIIENHPDIITKAQAWAADKSNVTIIEGSWFDIKDTLSTYDGLFYDTWGDLNNTDIWTLMPSFMKPGGKATWWGSHEELSRGFDNVTFDIYNVNPPTNQYFNHNQYYLPKKQF
jgi:protein arginine N-methyltransferase 2